jgi:Glycoside-hydrolase family GH114
VTGQIKRRMLAGAAAGLAGAAALIVLSGSNGSLDPATSASPPPPNAGFDYQIGGDYPLPDGVSVVSRDWFIGEPAADPVYSICYVNAFQTQANEAGVDRPDERSNWPRGLILDELGDDPKWGGEYLVDISTAKKRRRAASWVDQMVEGCERKGFEAVEYDNLDSWTRFDGTPLADEVPFEKRQALAYARLLAGAAHSRGLAVGQKNTADVTGAQAREVGFDFAIAEECARYRECGRYRRVHGDRVIVIEYRREDFRRACRTVGDALSVVLRDRLVSTPSSRRYVFDAC